MRVLRHRAGGTWFEALGDDGVGAVVDAAAGHAVAFAGPLRHAGNALRSSRLFTLFLKLLHPHNQDYVLLPKYCMSYLSYENQCVC